MLAYFLVRFLKLKRGVIVTDTMPIVHAMMQSPITRNFPVHLTINFVSVWQISKYRRLSLNT